jgi:mono/diheme cytochrome c family protein
MLREKGERKGIRMMPIANKLAPWRRRFGMALFVLVSGAATTVFCSFIMAQGRPGTASAAAGNVANGKKVFSTKRCEGCHGSEGQGGQGQNAGPQIAPPPTDLAAFIRQVRKPNDIMPAFSEQQVSDAELRDTYAFLKSIQPAAASAPAPAATGNGDNGKRLYVSAGCYECHSREGQGGAGTGPRLAPSPIPFAAFIRQCRQPSNQMPPYTSKVLSDAQLNDIYAFLQSVPKPPDVSSIPLLQ